MREWSETTIPWERFEGNQVDPELLALVKAASLVEGNAADYRVYLQQVFADDPAFAAEVDRWADEEIKHGEVLGRWAELADPSFDFRAALERFRAGYRLPVDATASVRGSRTGEMTARCIVETGTSTLYFALRDASREPVLCSIAHWIATDEIRHYTLFYRTLQKYAVDEGVSRWQRLRVILGRIRESGDDELAYAYHCANCPPEARYNRRWANRRLQSSLLAHYAAEHRPRTVRLIVRAAGFPTQGPWFRWALRGWNLYLTAQGWALRRMRRPHAWAPATSAGD